jgi:hypothetical protein
LIDCDLIELFIIIAFELTGADEAALRKMVQKVAASAPVPRAALQQEQVAAVGSKRARSAVPNRREAADSLRGQRAQVAREEVEEEEDGDDDDEGEDDDDAAEEDEDEDEDEDDEQDTAAEQTRARPTHGTAPVHAAASATTLSDMHLTCKDCQQPFIFTVIEQQTFLHYGYSIPRIRCKPCSEAKKLGNYNKAGGFFKSETGHGAAGPQPAAASRHEAHVGGRGSGKGKGGSWDGFGGRGGGEGSIRARGNGANGTGGRDKGGGGKGGVGKSGPPGGGTSFDTRKCFAFQQGTCNRGAACKFMHA